MLIPILVAAAIIILAGLATVLVARLQQKNRARTIQVELCNLGNVQSRFELQATDPQRALKFLFSLNGDELPESADSLEPIVPPQASNKATPTFRSSSGESAVQGEPEAGKVGVGAIGDQAMEGSGVIASMLATLSMLLPRSVGAPLRQTAAQMQRGRISASRVKQLKSQSKRLKPKGLPRRGGNAQPAASVRPASAAVTVDSEPHNEEELAGSLWAQTPYVQPGGVLMAELQIRPVRSPLRPWERLAKSYPFTVLSRSGEMHSPDGLLPVVTAEASIGFSETSWLLRLLPYFVILAVTLGALVLTFLLAGAG